MVSNATIDEATVWRALATVTDPEIPVISVVDMGIVAGVRVDGDTVAVDITPTFSGCPALAVIRENVRGAVLDAGARQAEVRIVYDPPWTSDRITPDGRRKLKEFGLAPPGKRCATTPDLEQVPCPFCDSNKTQMESIFGPTLCRSIHYCQACQQSFEYFKPV